MLSGSPAMGAKVGGRGVRRNRSSDPDACLKFSYDKSYDTLTEAR
jgi:hypothetical protein